MKIACPSCTKPLTVKDEVAGRRVKCPSCQDVFRVPEAAPVVVVPVEELAATEVSDRPLPAKKSAAPVPAAVKTGAPPKPARRPCPECGATLAADAEACPECDWTAEPVRTVKSRRSVRTDDDIGGCYIHIRKDDVDLNQEIEKRMEKLIETEQLDMRIMDYRDEPPEELGPNDLVIGGRVKVAEYGSQFIRYFLTFIAMFGPGSCKLEVEAEVETSEDGRRPHPHSARQWMGIFGGTGTGLMKANVMMVAARIANGAARQITGRRFLNYHAYICGYWSLGLGLASLIPFLGILLAPIGIICGLIAFVTISRRDLPRGKVVAITGLVSGMIGFLVSVGLIILAQVTQ